MNTERSTALLLVNLGTPEAPTAPALRRYLGEFLSDRRVVELPRLLWWPILHGIILNTRPAKSAAKYRSVWTARGSPLKVHTEDQAALLQTRLAARGLAVRVDWAMRYGQPALPAVLSRLRREGVARILLMPLYPQYAASTTATVVDVAATWLQSQRNQPEMRFMRSFPEHPAYLAALENSVRMHWQEHGPLTERDCLVISFHGLPRRCSDLGDPYEQECQRTAAALAARLGLAERQLRVTFQSRFGRAEWLQPYTDETLAALARQGTRRVDVICPGFVSDCLETLEEIAIEGRETFLHAGGLHYHMVAALNTRADWIEALEAIASPHLAGWLPTAPG